MSESKFIMAKKLFKVQKSLMELKIQDFGLDSLLSLIFKACATEQIVFGFNFFEDGCVLNLRDIGRENTELNIRYFYSRNDENIDDVKVQVLKNAFNLTSTPLDASSAKNEESIHIVSGDKPVPSHIRQAIKKLEAKGVPVTVEGIRNHLPLNEMSSNSRIKCNAYLKNMEASE